MSLFPTDEEILEGVTADRDQLRLRLMLMDAELKKTKKALASAELKAYRKVARKLMEQNRTKNCIDLLKLELTNFDKSIEKEKRFQMLRRAKEQNDK